jgi:phosphoglycolate phosphatase
MAFVCGGPCLMTLKPAVIFDFDGTIADTFKISIGIFEKMTKRDEVFSDEEIEHLRGLTGLHVLKELHIKPWLVPFMLIRGRSMMRRSLPSIAVFEGIKPLIAELYESGVPLYITSSNSTGNILEFLREQGMDQYFIRVYGNVSVFGKARVLRRVISGNKLDPARVTYIGDETRDVEAAKHVGIRCVSVTWGFNTAGLLKTHDPDAIANTPAELAALLRSDKSTESVQRPAN